MQPFGDDVFKIGMTFLLTHPSRGATCVHDELFQKNVISTHTPLTGCNLAHLQQNMGHLNFYSHTPHGVQQDVYSSKKTARRFLLTHPSRGATQNLKASEKDMMISTHTPLTGCNRKIMYFTANCTPYNVGVDFFKNLY